MKILFGYDGSNVCKDAFKVAREHAKAFGAKLQVVASLEKGTEDQQSKISALEKELAYLKSQVTSDGTECDTHLLIRGLTPGEDLISFAKEKDVNQIVIGIKRRSKVGKLLFGSTAQFVILSAPCPVVTVR